MHQRYSASQPIHQLSSRNACSAIAYLFDRKPSVGGVLGTNNQRDIVLGSETVVDSADTRVGIGREVDPSQASGKRDETSNELYVSLMRRLGAIKLTPGFW
jgi:hypothetical protein